MCIIISARRVGGVSNLSPQKGWSCRASGAGSVVEGHGRGRVGPSVGACCGDTDGVRASMPWAPREGIRFR